MLYPPEAKVRDSRLLYYKSMGLPNDGGASEKVSRAVFGPLVFYVPGFPARTAALLRHDLHHVILDADTSVCGEALLAAWEVGSGCGTFWFSWALEPQVMFFGIFLHPKEIFEAFIQGRHSRNLYSMPFENRWLEISVGELRDLVLAKGEYNSSLKDAFLFFLALALGSLELAVTAAVLLLPVAVVLVAIC